MSSRATRLTPGLLRHSTPAELELCRAKLLSLSSRAKRRKLEGAAAPAPALAPAPTQAPAPALKDFLGEKIFVTLQEKLDDLGVDEIEDLRFVDEDDLADLCSCLKKVQAKKLSHKVAQLARS